jgi:hypothetical protein
LIKKVKTPIEERIIRPRPYFFARNCPSPGIIRDENTNQFGWDRTFRELSEVVMNAVDDGYSFFLVSKKGGN